jgi:hypothetical protein
MTGKVMLCQFCTKSPNSMHPKNQCQSLRTYDKIHYGAILGKDVTLRALVQIIIQHCFMLSETKLDNKVWFINPIIAVENESWFSLIKPS